MVQFEKWKIWMVVAIIVGCIIVSLPNLFSAERLQSMPSWFPKNQVNLGLDLQGGSHLLLEVDLNALEAERLESLVDSIRVALRRAQIGYTNLAAKGGAVAVEIRDSAQVETARGLIEQAANGLDINVNGPVITAKYNQATLDLQRNHGGALNIAFNAGDLAGETQPGLRLQTQLAIQQPRAVDESIPVQPAEARELGLLKARNHESASRCRLDGVTRRGGLLCSQCARTGSWQDRCPGRAGGRCPDR